MESIGVRELRQHASRWLARVQAGESFRVTDRGRPVAVLAPLASSTWDDLVAAGQIELPRDDGDLLDIAPLPAATAVSLSALLAEDREDE